MKWGQRAGEGTMPFGFVVVGCFGFVLPLILTLGALQTMTKQSKRFATDAKYRCFPLASALSNASSWRQCTSYSWLVAMKVEIKYGESVSNVK